MTVLDDCEYDRTPTRLPDSLKSKFSEPIDPGSNSSCSIRITDGGAKNLTGKPPIKPNSLASTLEISIRYSRQDLQRNEIKHPLAIWVLSLRACIENGLLAFPAVPLVNVFVQ